MPPGFVLDAPAPAPAPDKYQQAAIAERDRLKAAGVSLPEGFTRRVSAGPLLGWGDEVGAAMTTPLEMIRHGTFDPREGYRYGKAREELASQKAREKTGLAGDVTEVVGGLATLPGNVFARQASSALGGGTAARIAGYGAEGAALGGIQGAGTAETVGDIPGQAASGAALGGLFAAPFGAFANVARRSTAVVPSEAELSGLGARDYRARDRLPVSYDLERVADRMQAVEQATRRKYGRDAPQATGTLRDLVEEARNDVAAARALNPNQPGTVAAPGQVAPNPWTAVATPRDISSLRREIYEGGAKGSPTDERAGTVASKIVDRILSRPDPAMLAPGVNPRDAATAAMLTARGRGNFGAGYRSRAVTEEVQKAMDTASGQHSGLNFENILRQNLNRARKNENFGGFNAAEEAAAEKLIKGTAAANARRELGNMLGGGGGLGRVAAMGAGGAGTGAVGAYLTGQDPVFGAAAGLGLGVTGRALRSSGINRAKEGAEAFAAELRQRSPEYLKRLAAAPTEIGPGLSSSAARGAKQLLTIGGEGAIRDAIVQALTFQATGQRPKRITIDTPRR